MDKLLNTAAVVGHNQPVELPKLTDQQKQAIAKTMDSLAEKLSSIVTDEINSIIVQVEKAKKDWQGGPFAVLGWFKKNVPAETLALFPTPGSDVGDQPDKYDEPYYRDGKLKFRKTSFYLKFFLSSFPEGKRIAAALAHIAIAKDEKANQAAVPEDIRKLNPVQLESLREDLGSQRDAGVKAVRDALALEKQFTAVNELAEVSAAPLLDDDGNVKKINKPIKIWNDKSPDNEWALYSISGFMQFDPARAAELGGSYDALKLTAKRDPSEDGGAGTGDKPVIINTNATLVARINDIAEYIANKLVADKKRELYGQFLKDHIATADAGDLIYNLNEIKLFVDGVLNIPTCQSKLEAIQAKRNAA